MRELQTGCLGGAALVDSARRLFWAELVFLLMTAALPGRADQTYTYTVQISAVVQESPAQITLNWEPDPYGANSYTVYRKLRDDTDWGTGAVLDGSATNYVDTNVVMGATYEYQIVKDGVPGYTGYGYIYCGIRAPLIESRGMLDLVVATNSTGPLSNELAQLQLDLIGDGWQVLRCDVSSNDSPEDVHAQIVKDYNATGRALNALFLFGHVPILQSGELAYDGHTTRPMPADAYYGDMLNDWPTDPSNSPSYLPSDVKLMIGRVDLADMPGNDSPYPWPNETELLRNYLNKDHRWRNKLIPVRRQALMANRYGDADGEAMAASGYRNFEPMVGPGNTIEANVEDTAPDNERWISMVTSNSYLWSYGCGAGSDTSVSYLGLNGDYFDVWSSDIVDGDAQAVFTMFFGSWFGNWDHTDNLMRSILATPSMGLTSCEAGRPHWFFHHMTMGEPIGFSTRLTMNNDTLYQNEVNLFTRAVYIALMGDPTLRLDPVAPPPSLSAVAGSNAVTLSWAPSHDPVLGYHVYRATSALGPFTRLTSSLLTNSAYTDYAVNPATYTYMVRAVALQTNPSGSYYNPSEGIFATVPSTSAVPPIQVQAHPMPDGILLTWNTVPGASYRVLASPDLRAGNWGDITGSMVANGTQGSWTDPIFTWVPQRFYRIVSP